MSSNCSESLSDGSVCGNTGKYLEKPLRWDGSIVDEDAPRWYCGVHAPSKQRERDEKRARKSGSNLSAIAAMYGIDVRKE